MNSFISNRPHAVISMIAQAVTHTLSAVPSRVGRTIRHIVAEFRTTILGWQAYFGFTEMPSPLTDLDKWIRRRLWNSHGKQWGHRRNRELRQRGVSADLA